MKIIQLITRLIRGGAQRVALETAAFLAAEGHHSELWTGPESGPEGSLLDEARARGLVVRVFPELTRSLSLTADPAALLALSRALRQARPDWVHTHSSKAGILGREAAARAQVAAIAHTVHGFGFTPETPGVLRSIYVALERREARRTRALVFVAEEDRREAERLGIRAAGKAVLIPPGIDLEPWIDDRELLEAGSARRRELGISDRTLLLGLLGRLAPQKNPLAAIEILREVVARGLDARLLVVGDGALRDEARAAAERHSIGDRVNWAGLQTEPRSWLAAMDVLLLPSRWEGTPLTIMEAMASGRAIVASALPGVAQLLESGREGRLYPLERPAEAVEAIVTLKSEAIDARVRCSFTAMGQAARTRALREHGRGTMLARLLEVYQSMGS